MEPGKSTLTKVLAGDLNYTIDSGNIFFNNKNLLKLSPELRFLNGLFLSFQNPIEFNEIIVYDFLKLIYENKQKYLKLNYLDFDNKLKKEIINLNINYDLLLRPLNLNFSGGEKKKLEFLQVLLFNPKLIIFDEIDAGLDFKTLNYFINIIINKFKNNKSILLITHNQNLLKKLSINKIYFLENGVLKNKI